MTGGNTSRIASEPPRAAVRDLETPPTMGLVTGHEPFDIAGDDGVGSYSPPIVRRPDFPRLPAAVVRDLNNLESATPAVSDLLDGLGLSLSVPADVLCPRHVDGVVAGHAVTLRYLPERRSLANPELRREPSRLAHLAAFDLAAEGDVLVVDAAASRGVSALGGVAALAAKQAGLAACIVDGGIRDLAEVRAMRLPLWSRSLTPRTGKWRLEAVSINEAVSCGGVQVSPGDLVIADESGVCFVPAPLAPKIASELLRLAAAEMARFEGWLDRTG